MAYSVFVSYKYKDNQVQPFRGISSTTARNYVDALEKHLTNAEHIYKGEKDGEDLSDFKDSTIQSGIADKIFSSSVTIVLISKGMVEKNIPEDDQWIPWEIRYSLREQTRAGGRSTMNAIIAVVLPDEFGSYEHFIKENPECDSITIMTNQTFQIIGRNMFNAHEKDKNVRECKGSKIYTGNPSYIISIKWSDFILNTERHINQSKENQKNSADFAIQKNILPD